jgi:hypothetical protein
MKEIAEIALFMERIRIDPRIGPLHISLYMSLFSCWILQGATGPVLFTAKELMPIAKIAGGTTFHRCIKQLHAYGYIVYEPSFHAVVKSRAYLVGKKEG